MILKFFENNKFVNNFNGSGIQAYLSGPDSKLFSLNQSDEQWSIDFKKMLLTMRILWIRIFQILMILL